MPKRHEQRSGAGTNAFKRQNPDQPAAIRNRGDHRIKGGIAPLTFEIEDGASPAQALEQVETSAMRFQTQPAIGNRLDPGAVPDGGCGEPIADRLRSPGAAVFQARKGTG